MNYFCFCYSALMTHARNPFPHVKIHFDNRVTCDMTETSGLAAPVTRSLTSGQSQPTPRSSHLPAQCDQCDPQPQFPPNCYTRSPHNASFVNKIQPNRKGHDPMYANSHEGKGTEINISNNMNGISDIRLIFRSTEKQFN